MYDHLLVSGVCVCNTGNRVVLATDWTALLPGTRESLVYPAKILPGSKRGFSSLIFFFFLFLFSFLSK